MNPSSLIHTTYHRRFERTPRKRNTRVQKNTFLFFFFSSHSSQPCRPIPSLAILFLQENDEDDSRIGCVAKGFVCLSSTHRPIIPSYTDPSHTDLYDTTILHTPPHAPTVILRGYKYRTVNTKEIHGYESIQRHFATLGSWPRPQTQRVWNLDSELTNSNILSTLDVTGRRDGRTDGRTKRVTKRM